MKNFTVLFLLFAISQKMYAGPLTIATLGDFKTEDGAIIKDCKIGYRQYGKLNANKTNAILFTTWFSGNTEGLVKYTQPWNFIDTTKYQLILVDALGDGVSSSPSNSFTQHGNRFPQITIRDMVKSQYLLLTQKLKVNHLYAIFGISMGGMQAYQWAAGYPAFVDRIIPIVGSPQLTSIDIINATMLKKLVEQSPAFNNGNYTTNPAIPLASMMLQMSLTSPMNNAKTIKREDAPKVIASFNSHPEFDWNNFDCQITALLTQDIAKDDNGSLPQTAKRIKARLLAVNNKQDHVVNPLPALTLTQLLNGKIILLDNEMGHNGVDFNSAEFKNAVNEILKPL